MRISDWSSDVCSSDLLAFSYVGERFKDRITEFAADFGSKLVFDCDVGDDAQIAKLFTDLSQTWPRLDRKSVVSGKSVSVRVDLGGRRIIKKKIKDEYADT